MTGIRLVVVIFLISLVAVGCSKKPTQTAGLSGLGPEGEDKDVVTQTVTSPESETPQAEPKAVAIPATAQPIQVQAQPQAQIPSPNLDRNKQIQTALKNANLYLGEVDGKMGPLTRKAVEEFQKMKGLKADGKVGPATWGELQKYLSAAPSISPTAATDAKKKNR